MKSTMFKNVFVCKNAYASYESSMNEGGKVKKFIDSFLNLEFWLP